MGYKNSIQSYLLLALMSLFCEMTTTLSNLNFPDSNLHNKIHTPRD